MKLTRPSISAVTSGLTTTADKIRALARAGYRRIEISKTLEVRYQHVRKVLVDAGIMGGLSPNLESARVKELIASALAEGKKVDVLIATPEPLDWNGLPVNTAAGLEAGLIRMIRPD